MHWKVPASSVAICYLANGMVTAPVATAWVQPIPKGSTPTVSEGGMEGVDDAQIFVQHRCITIGSLLAKVFTTLLDQRMTQYLEENGLRSMYQGGFRPKRGAAEQVFTLNHVSLANTGGSICTVHLWTSARRLTLLDTSTCGKGCRRTASAVT